MSYIKKIEGDTIVIYEGDQKDFWIQETVGETNMKAFLGGRLKSVYVHDFSDEMLAFVSIGMNLILDFSAVSYMSFSFMRALLSIQQEIEKKDAELKLIRLPEHIYGEFEKTGFSELLDLGV